MSGAGAAPSKAAKSETNGDDLLFAALFGGATGDMSADDFNGDANLGFFLNSYIMYNGYIQIRAFKTTE